MSLLKVNSLQDLGADAVVTNGVIVSSALPAGSILQVVSTTKTDTFSSSSTSFADVTLLSATITPSSASNKILVFATINMSTAQNYNGWTQLVRDSTPIFIGDANGSRTRASANQFSQSVGWQIGLRVSSFTHLDSPSTTSALTYKLQVKTESASFPVFVNRSEDGTNAATRTVAASSITVLEVAG